MLLLLVPGLDMGAGIAAGGGSTVIAGITNYENKQQQLRDATSATGLTYGGDWHRYWDSLGIQAGTFNERMIAWTNSVTSVDPNTMPEAQQQYASLKGFANWDSLNDLDLP